MQISVNDRLPDAGLLVLGDNGPERVELGDISRGRRIVVFAVPGAFTPTCHLNHVPSFVRNADEIRAKGVDEIICVTVNDPFVADAWSSSTGASDAGIRVLADADSSLTKALGMILDFPAAGLLTRSLRYSMLVDDGTVRILNVEDDPGVCGITSGGTLLGQL